MAKGSRLRGAAALSLLLLCFFCSFGSRAAALAQEEPSRLLGESLERAARAALQGEWRTSLEGVELELVLAEDGTFAFAGDTGTYRVSGGQLLLTVEETLAYQWSLADGRLTLTGADLFRALVLQRPARAPGYLAWVWDTTPQALGQRLHRILVVIGIVVAARVAIWIVRIVSELLIFSSWGPFGLLYRHKKNRARTLHSLVLNVVKYFVYFTALGTILAELGIDYTTYIASLSVIGLAIGFGSQGLVQDMVTGFFILFEGQFDVGDMVEIGGQSGYVTEIGLRMTKLRNYLGQIVVIPNRNIATVANYSRGAQRTYVDVALEGEEDAERALALLSTFGNELQRQYDGVILQPVRATGPTRLATGEVFVRLHFSLWPNQTWIVDGQLIPRLRERLRAAGIANPSDRIAAFYHARETVEIPRWRQHLARIREARERGEDAPERPAEG